MKNSDSDVSACRITASGLANLIKLIDDGTISGKIAKDVFAEMLLTGTDPAEVVKEKGLVQITDTGEIEKIIDEIIAASPKQVEGYRSGKTNLLGYFVGQVMKLTAGKANPQLVNELLKRKLE